MKTVILYFYIKVEVIISLNHITIKDNIYTQGGLRNVISETKIWPPVQKKDHKICVHN